MAWFNKLNIAGLWKGGAPAPIDETDANRLPTTSKIAKADGTLVDPATAAKQLPDNHQVAVSNMIPAVETGLATQATLALINTRATRTDGVPALEVSDDMTSGETFRQTLVASTDTTITFSQSVRLVRIKNESLTSTVFVRDGAISSDTPADAEMVGVAPVLNLPTVEYYPFKTTTIHLRSAGAPTLSVTGFY